MTDYSPAKITIGGENKRELLPNLLKEIRSQDLGIEYGESLPDDFEIEEGDAISFYTFEARYGEFEELETFCIENQIAFRRQSYAFSDTDPEAYIFIPGEIAQCFSTNDSERFVFTTPEISMMLSKSYPYKIERLRELQDWKPKPITFVE